MVVPMVRFRAFQVPFYSPTLSVHSTVGSSVSSYYHYVGTMGAILPLSIDLRDLPYKFRLDDPFRLKLLVRLGFLLYCRGIVE